MGGGWEEECGEWKAIGEVVNKARKGKMAVAAMGGLVGNFKTLRLRCQYSCKKRAGCLLKTNGGTRPWVWKS